jgi:hypothetical protein
LFRERSADKFVYKFNVFNNRLKETVSLDLSSPVFLSEATVDTNQHAWKRFSLVKNFMEFFVVVINSLVYSQLESPDFMFIYDQGLVNCLGPGPNGSKWDMNVWWRG